MNLSITGSLGSGKSSICKELIAMGYEVRSSGDIFRSIAAEKGISVVELNELAKQDRTIDDLIDARTRDLGKRSQDVIFDSRIGWNFLTESFNIFVYVDLDEAARRVFNDTNRKSEAYSDVEECKNALFKRQHLENDRYAELYGIDYYDVHNYHLVLDSTNCTPGELAKMIDAAYKEFKTAPFELRYMTEELEAKILTQSDSNCMLHG